jgi:hypothetical protein
MSKHLLTILLLISVALNAGIIGGMLVMGVYRQNHDIHHYRDSMENRDPHERDYFYPRVFEDENIKALRDTFRFTKDELMLELARENVDEAAIRAIIEESVNAQGSMERALGAKLLELRKTMSADEAEEYFTRRLERSRWISDRIKNRRD